MGEINLRDFYKSLTVQFKTTPAAKSLLLNRLIFVKEKKKKPGVFDRQKRNPRKRL